MSITRTTDRSLFDNVTSVGGDIDFDAASRFLIAQGSDGFIYVGDDQATDTYEPPAVDANGGEEILVEGTGGAAFFQGNVGSGTTVDENPGGTPFLVTTIVTAFTYDTVSYTIAQPSGGTYDIVGETIYITAGPGMGESRTIVSSSGGSGHLNSPWDVTPTSDSDCIISSISSDVTVFQNTIAGDGALSFLPDAAGVDVVGLNTTIDDNDISGLPVGVEFEAYSTSTDAPKVMAFNLITRNSLSDNAEGISVQTAYDNNPPESTVLGNVFRMNTVIGPAGPPNSGLGGLAAGIVITGHSFAPDSDDYDPAQALLTVIDQNTVTDYQIGIYFKFDSNTTNSSSGIVSTVISYNFFCSDGSSGSFGLSNDFYAPYETDDSDAYYCYFGNAWQNFWDPNSAEPG